MFIEASGMSSASRSGMLLSHRQESLLGSGGAVLVRNSDVGISLPLLTQWKASSCCRVPVLRLTVVGGEGSQLFF